PMATRGGGGGPPPAKIFKIFNKISRFSHFLHPDFFRARFIMEIKMAQEKAHIEQTKNKNLIQVQKGIQTKKHLVITRIQNINKNIDINLDIIDINDINMCINVDINIDKNLDTNRCRDR